jgi:hypothetical protein
MWRCHFRVLAIFSTTLITTLASCAQSRTIYAESGSWRIEGDLLPNQALSYVLWAGDPAASTKLEFWCQPAQEGTAIKITGRFLKISLGQEEINVTYAVDGGPPKQGKAYMYTQNEIVFPRGELGLGPFWDAVREAKHSIRISAKNVSAVVNVHGFSELDPTFARLCNQP